MRGNAADGSDEDSEGPARAPRTLRQKGKKGAVRKKIPERARDPSSASEASDKPRPAKMNKGKKERAQMATTLPGGSANPEPVDDDDDLRKAIDASLLDLRIGGNPLGMQAFPRHFLRR
jgi:hypothetical protein